MGFLIDSSEGFWYGQIDKISLEWENRYVLGSSDGAPLKYISTTS